MPLTTDVRLTYEAGLGLSSAFGARRSCRTARPRHRSRGHWVPPGGERVLQRPAIAGRQPARRSAHSFGRHGSGLVGSVSHAASVVHSPMRVMRCQCWDARPPNGTRACRSPGTFVGRKAAASGRVRPVGLLGRRSRNWETHRSQSSPYLSSHCQEPKPPG